MSALELLIAQIAALDPVDEREASSREATLDRLTWSDDPFDESAHDHHVTASAFVVSSRGVILHLHRRLNIWVQPGGHVDAGEWPAAAALRETREETGLDVQHASPPTLLHVDVHAGPRGHTHYDLRYVLLARPDDPRPAPGESPEVYWFEFDEARDRAEPGMRNALTKVERAIAGWRMRD